MDSKKPLKAAAVAERVTTSRRRLNIGRDDLEAAAEGVISEKQAGQLWDRLSARSAQKPGFDLANLAWYSGAVIVMIAMGWFLVELWDLWSGGAMLATSLVYAAAFFGVGGYFWRRGDLKVPGGLLTTLGVFMTPLAVFGLQRLAGWHEPGGFADHNDVAARLIIEVATIAVGFLALRFVRFPFITAPLTAAIGLAGMEAISLALGNVSWDQWQHITLAYGLAITAGSYLIDRRTEEDYAFWGYLVGVTAFWWSLTLMGSGSELGRLGYALINVGLMVFSVLSGRRVFVLYGAAGVVWYLGYLALELFSGSVMFPIALSGMGVAVIFAGIQYHRNRERIENALVSLVPESLRSWLPRTRG